MALVDFLDNSVHDDRAVAPAPPDLRATRFHESIPGYAPTRLAEAPKTAAQLGLSHLYVKLETERFGLPSFKPLGASWATCRAISLRSGLPPAATFDELLAMIARLDGLSLVTATDGNHGRAVAWIARMLGLGARILLPRHAAQARVEAIEREGATVTLVDGTYDDAVREAALLADDDHVVISDTSWPGYTQVPGWVADGYTTIFAELGAQLAAAGARASGTGEPVAARGDERALRAAKGDGSAAPRLVAIQIGVGALASAAVRALATRGRVVVGVEPGDADCVLQAVRAGAPVLVPGPHRSLMAGLNCGLASQLALPDMAAGIDAFCTIDDASCEEAVRLLLRDGLRCGETGAAGVAGLLALRERWPDDTWSRLGLGDDPRPAGLVVCTEAPTNPESFARITADP